MYWQVTEITRGAPTPDVDDAPRFVLHRHEDNAGVHHDLRLEEGNCLLGFRVAGDAFEKGRWATEKMPHPKEWLEHDRDAQRVLKGRYQWREAGTQQRELLLFGQDATVTVRLERCDAPSVDTVRALMELTRDHALAHDSLAGLVEDGLTARRNAIARFCGLSRELDGDGFDEEGWRALLAGMTLRQVGERLAAIETRYDRLHPPQPASRPEPLDRDIPEDRAQKALQILNA